MQINFSTFYATYYKKSFLFVKSYVRDDMAAEDIVSDVLMQLWELSKHEEIGNPKALLLTMLKNQSLNHLKHESIKIQALGMISEKRTRDIDYRITTLEACDPTEIFSSEVVEIVRQTLQLLPDATCQVFTMSRYDGKSAKEIADELGMTVKGVEYHMAKALKLLRVSLKDYLPMILLII